MKPIEPLLNRTRWLLSIVAFVGTALFALSFLPFDRTSRYVSAPFDLRKISPGIALAAGSSWLVLGLVLFVESRRKPGRLALWFDTCLLTMGVGEFFLLLAAAYNAYFVLFTPGTTPAQDPVIVIVALADLMMARAFVDRARQMGVQGLTSVTWWVLVLNGSFALILWGLAGPLGYD